MPPWIHGAIAQLVEQRTENPCVAGSIPAGTTSKIKISHNIQSERKQKLAFVFRKRQNVGERSEQILIFSDKLEVWALFDEGEKAKTFQRCIQNEFQSESEDFNL